MTEADHPGAASGQPDEVTEEAAEKAAEDVSADAVAEAALACPYVVALGAHGPAQLATYLPGRRVVGVAVRDDACEVAVVLRTDGTRPLPELADEVRRAVEPVTGGREVHVVIVDVVLPGEEHEPYPDEGGTA